METLNYDLIINKFEHHNIPNKTGIYILFNNNDVVLYVGKSVNLKHRVQTHLYGWKNSPIRKFANQIEKVAIIFHTDVDTLHLFETKTILSLKPLLNNDKVDYDQDYLEVDTVKQNVQGVRCTYQDSHGNDCRAYASKDNFCHAHNPLNFNLPWTHKGKLITSEMNRLIYDMEHNKKSKPMYFRMSRYTFRKLLNENTFANINEIPKYKQHYIIIDEIDEIRLKRWDNLQETEW